MAAKSSRSKGGKKEKAQAQEKKKTIVIRDPVHGYVRIAPHERIIVDHPITQRLRHVLQTGLAHLVFPEARTSRFVHSLGAMQLASRFLIACVENADFPVAEKFFNSVEELPHLRDGMINLEELDLLWASDEPGTQTGLLASRAVFPGNHDASEERRRRRLLAFAESGLRLAALFHDLGHLPFSHDLEFALEVFVQKKRKAAQKHLPHGVEQVMAEGMPPHEVVGHKLAELVLSSLIEPQQTPPATRAVYRLAKDILNTEPPYVDKEQPRAGILEWLHSLIDGEVDADRGDYLLRDGRALGFEFATYDLERLVDHLILVCEDDLGFATAIREAGLSALETFFMSRARSNLSMVRHHKNAQAGAAFRYASVAAFDTKQGGQFLEALGALFNPQLKDAKHIRKVLEDFAAFDDPFWMEALRAIPKEEQTPLLSACLALVLTRSRSLRSLWKRKGDVPVDKVSRLNILLSSTEPGVAGGLERRLQTLEGKGVLFIKHRFTPFRIFERRNDSSAPSGDERKTYSVMLVRTEKRGLQPAARLSSLIRGLHDAWAEEPHLHAFVQADSDLDATEALDKLLEAGTVNPPRGTETLRRGKRK
jgi:HD superfamily phosphohydrolase